jgi:hypothetical protein
MTHPEITTHDGRPALKITCPCSTHPQGMASAVVVEATEFPADRIHGYVLMAHHPARLISGKANQKGIYAIIRLLADEVRA